MSGALALVACNVSATTAFGCCVASLTASRAGRDLGIVMLLLVVIAWVWISMLSVVLRVSTSVSFSPTVVARLDGVDSLRG